MMNLIKHHSKIKIRMLNSTIESARLCLSDLIRQGLKIIILIFKSKIFEIFTEVKDIEGGMIKKR